MRVRGRSIIPASATLGLLLGALAAGCGGGDEDGSKAAAAKPAVRAGFDPAAFGNPARGTNRWEPVVPGRQSVREGRVNVGHRRLTHRRVYTVTDVTKAIDGVRAVAVIDQDFNGGQLAEQAIDYLAEDRQGNVWYLGSYTETYEAGQFVNATDGWLAGVKGAEPGVLMPAHPRAGTSFSEAKLPGGGTERRRSSRRASRGACLPVLPRRPGHRGGRGVRRPEYKYYAPGVGGS